MQSDGRSSEDHDDLISTYVPAGSYFIEVQDLGGAGTCTIALTARPATPPSQPLPVGDQGQSPGTGMVAGDFNGDAYLDLAVTNVDYYSTGRSLSVLLGN